MNRRNMHIESTFGIQQAWRLFLVRLALVPALPKCVAGGAAVCARSTPGNANVHVSVWLMRLASATCIRLRLVRGPARALITQTNTTWAKFELRS
jgi:hypothetical protein